MSDGDGQAGAVISNYGLNKLHQQSGAQQGGGQSTPVKSKSHKSKTGFVGLKNMGCICYMNSTLQQVFYDSIQ